MDSDVNFDWVDKNSVDISVYGRRNAKESNVSETWAEELAQ